MSLNEADFNYVQALVERRSAIVLEDQKKYLVEARLGNLARREGFDSLTSLVIQLRAGSGRDDLHDKVVECMTINETTFFRDVHPFEALRKEVLPPLLRQRGSERRLRIWCAASSSGQEPYSIAMLLREHFPELASWELQPDGGQSRSAGSTAGEAFP
jgi:chemotaxis protein methyltransferase CheR